MAPDVERLPHLEIGQATGSLRVDDLLPIFSTNFRRQIYIVRTADAVVEVAFDDGSIEAGDQTEALSEVELELREGDLASLYDLGLLMVAAAPLRLGTQSKSERGYALAFGGGRSAHKALPTVLEPNVIHDGVAALLSGCQRHLVANLSVAEKGRDIGGVHQARVALRRLRTALSLLRRELPSALLQGLASDARALARVLGPARNWDVFVFETLAALQADGPSDLDFAALVDATEPIQGKSYEELRVSLAAQQTNRFLLLLGLVIERRSWRNDTDALPALMAPVADVADRALARLHLKALKQGRDFKAGAAEKRHELRLTLKNLRYATEFFFPLLLPDLEEGLPEATGTPAGCAWCRE